LKIGLSPEIGLLKSSRKVIEIAEVETPSALTGVVPRMVEVVALGLPGIKTTRPSAFATGVAMERVLLSALVDESVQVETPEAFPAEHIP
jgi:hypothetical protein